MIRGSVAFVILLLVGYTVFFVNVPFESLTQDEKYYFANGLSTEDFQLSEFILRFSRNDIGDVVGYQPLTLASFYLPFLNSNFHQMQVPLHKYLHLMLHLLNSFLLFWLTYLLLDLFWPKEMEYLGNRSWIASIAGLIVCICFFLHPLQQKMVFFLWSRSYLLSTFFILASLLSFIGSRKYLLHAPGVMPGYRHKAAAFYRLTCILTLVLALLSSELGLIIPLIILFFDNLAYSKREKKYRQIIHGPLYLTLAGVLVVYLFWRFFFLPLHEQPLVVGLLSNNDFLVQSGKSAIFPSWQEMTGYFWQQLKLLHVYGRMIVGPGINHYLDWLQGHASLGPVAVTVLFVTIVVEFFILAVARL